MPHRPCAFLRLSLFTTALAVAALQVASCSDESVDPAVPGCPSCPGSGGAGAGGGGADLWPNLACDPLVPELCGYPFPSNVFTVADDATVTGRRVSFLDGMLPESDDGYKPKGDPWSRSDGFSASASLITYLPGASGTGLPDSVHIADSLAAGAPTVILDAESGERVAHFSEIDHSGVVNTERALLLRPAKALGDGRRYIVAVRGIVDGAGAAVAPSPAFAALRDGGDFAGDASVAARRALYDDIFTKLEAASVARDGLQMAWDFTTASRESNTGWMVHMRDEALAAAGDTGPAFTITQVDTAFDPAIAYKIDGTFTAPLYLDKPGQGGVLVFGDDGMPTPNADTPTYEVPFELLIPQSALTAPAKLLQYGHGLLGARSQIESDHFRTFMNEYNYAFFGVDLVGMADDDEGFIVEKIVAGEVDNLHAMFDRLHQGQLNSLLAMRMVSRGLDVDPEYGAFLDGEQRFYFGISQGGIMGGVYMALSTDVERGALEVMGQPYSLLLNRSVDFDPFFAVLNIALPDARKQQAFLGAIQMLWDRVEPSGYTKYIVNDPLPGTQPHSVLLRAAIGDHQVTTLGAHVMARTVGAKHLDTGLRDIYGLEKVSGPVTGGAAYAEYDFGLPDEPICDVPPREICEDPHGKLRKLEEARQQLDHFLTTGELQSFCAGGVCTHPELSGCVGGEDTVALCELPAD
ncbi:MAG: hypothetical protein WKG00_33820 [Polyangiaceae bacterium]